MRLFETNENEAIDSPTPRKYEDKTPHCKMYNPIYGGGHNRESPGKGMYLWYNSSHRPTKTSKARPLRARIRRETRGQEEGIDTETMSEGKKGTRVTLWRPDTLSA